MTNRPWIAITFACAFGAVACTARPVHFPSSGSSWTLPMVEPLISAGIVVPATIHGKGPYLFLLDPDAVTSVDAAVADEVGLFSRADSWQQKTTAGDRNVPRRPFEILKWGAGDLELSNFIAYTVPPGSLEVAGRQVHGILGGELLTRTIVIDMDRDRGVVRLTSASSFEAPEGAVTARGRALRNPSFATRGLAVPARLEGRTEELVVALAAPATALRTPAFEQLRAPEVAYRRPWIDDSGELLESTSAKLTRVELAGGAQQQILVDRFPDRRLWSWDFVGVIGQDMLARYRSIYDRDRRHLHLVPRDSDLTTRRAERIARWGARIRGCSEGQCVRAQLIDGGRSFVVTTASGSGVASVVLEGVGEDGRGLGYPLVQVNVREGAAVVVTTPSFPNPAEPAGYRVVDVVPFAASPGLARWEYASGQTVSTRAVVRGGPGTALAER